jgi:hypothetical protein
MDLFAVRRIKSKKPVGLFWARRFASAEPDGLRAMVATHCSPELCEAAIVDQPVAFVGAGFAARAVDLKSLPDWRPLIDDGERRPFLIRIMVRGKPYYYFRVGDDRTRLPGQPGETQFEDAYAAALAAETSRRAKSSSATEQRP